VATKAPSGPEEGYSRDRPPLRSRPPQAYGIASCGECHHTAVEPSGSGRLGASGPDAARSECSLNTPPLRGVARVLGHHVPPLLARPSPWSCGASQGLVWPWRTWCTKPWLWRPTAHRLRLAPRTIATGRAPRAMPLYVGVMRGGRRVFGVAIQTLNPEPPDCETFPTAPRNTSRP